MVQTLQFQNFNCKKKLKTESHWRPLTNIYVNFYFIPKKMAVLKKNWSIFISKLLVFKLYIEWFFLHPWQNQIWNHVFPGKKQLTNILHESCFMLCVSLKSNEHFHIQGTIHWSSCVFDLCTTEDKISYFLRSRNCLHFASIWVDPGF